MKYKIIETFDYHEKHYGFKIGKIYSGYQKENGDIFLLNDCDRPAHFYEDMVLPLKSNRDILRQFVKDHGIRTNAVSRALGYKKNWLSQHVGRKDRKDMSDETLNKILKKLHIDWASDQWLTVKAEVPYRTKPCNYPEGHHRERLQRAFWDGLVMA